MKKIAFACLLSLSTMQSWAARPFVTDDARLTTASSCQLESWIRKYPDSSELWILPACNFGGNLEITMGGGGAKNTDSTTTSDYIFQAKTLFRPLTSNNFGWGLSLGTVRHPEINPGPNQLGNTYAYLPFSASFENDAIIMHTNLGWLQDQATRQDNLTWGIGGEFQTTSSRISAIAEAFGDNHNPAYWQVGGRFAIIPDRVQIDATIGQQFSGASAGRWLSFGLRLTPEHLF